MTPSTAWLAPMGVYLVCSRRTSTMLARARSHSDRDISGTRADEAFPEEADTWRASFAANREAQDWVLWLVPVEDPISEMLKRD